MSERKIDKLMEYMSKDDIKNVKKQMKDILKDKVRERVTQCEKED